MGDWVRNPYVEQVDKFVNSLGKLSRVFLKLEGEKEVLSREEIEQMYQSVVEEVCGKCDNWEQCSAKDSFCIRQMLHEVFCTAEDYGAQLSVEMKRGMQKRCVQAPRFLRIALEALREIKSTRAWNRRMTKSREGCAEQLDSFAHVIQHATKELDASIFSDAHLEKKLKAAFLKQGLKLLSTVFFVTKEGRFEIHITGKVGKGSCVATQEVAKIVSACTGRKMVPAYDEKQVLGTEYETVVCVESVKYYTVQGIAKIGKGCDKISGDTFSKVDTPDGKTCMILSDGMGAGEEAYRESALVVELLEELLEAGFPKETALQMLNTAIVMGREEVKFSTIDMSVLDLYSGTCEVVKAGAPPTFIKRKDGVEVVRAESLPIGVVSTLGLNRREVELEEGDIIVMVTDGVLDALPIGQEELLMKKVIEGTEKANLKEFAHHILEQALACQGGVPADDMTVLVIGIWSLEK